MKNDVIKTVVKPVVLYALEMLLLFGRKIALKHLNKI